MRIAPFPPALVGLLLLASAFPLPAQVRLEANLGLRLFNIIPAISALELDIENTAAYQITKGDPLLSGDAETWVPLAAFFGIYGEYLSPANLSAGLELTFLKTSAPRRRTAVANDDYKVEIKEGETELLLLRFGPLVRYYFLGDRVKPTWQPFIFLGLGYTYWSIDMKVLGEKLREGALNFSLGGGVAYQVIPEIYVGAYLRGDLNLSVKGGQLKDYRQSGDVLESKTRWLPVSVVFLVGFSSPWTIGEF